MKSRTVEVTPASQFRSTSHQETHRTSLRCRLDLPVRHCSLDQHRSELIFLLGLAAEPSLETLCDNLSPEQQQTLLRRLQGQLKSTPTITENEQGVRNSRANSHAVGVVSDQPIFKRKRAPESPRQIRRAPPSLRVEVEDPAVSLALCRRMWSLLIGLFSLCSCLLLGSSLSRRMKNKPPTSTCVATQRTEKGLIRKTDTNQSIRQSGSRSGPTSKSEMIG